MKQYFIKTAMILYIIFSCGFFSCTKYEKEGNSNSFKRKVSGNWSTSSVIINDCYYVISNEWQTIYGTNPPITVYFKPCEVLINKDGSFENFKLPNGNELEQGIWSLNEEKTAIHFEANNGESSTFQILKLKRKEMELQHIKSEEDMTTYIYPSMNNQYYKELILRMKRI